VLSRRGHLLPLTRRGVRWIAEPGLPHMIVTLPGGAGGRDGRAGWPGAAADASERSSGRPGEAFWLSRRSG
jgi:hypothetical protein